MKSKIIFCLLFMFSEQIFARDWTRVEIPGAKCGNGSNYSVLVDKKSTEKLVIEFMGGGACWSASTCYGPSLKTWIFPIPALPSMSLLSSESELAQTWSDHSYIYFPYCTGDVWIGEITTNYHPLFKTYHYGKTNVELALEYLAKNRIVEFKKVDDLLVWGASAGAIGSLVHTVTLDNYLRRFGVHKVVIADSPGLHFGQTFWEKFPDELYQNYVTALDAIGLRIRKDSGLVSVGLPSVFKKLSRWQIGIIQGTKDIIMSSVFGEITPKEHEKLVLGPFGVQKMAEGFSNVETWIMKTYMHTFLLLPESAKLTNDQHEEAIEFANRVYAK